MTKRAVLLEALASTPGDIDRLVRKLDVPAATWRPAGGWSCRDVVAHLLFVEPHFLARLRRIVAENEPAVAAIHPDTAAHDLSLPIAQLGEQFRARRAETLAFLGELSPGGWQRAAVHPQYGRMILRLFVQVMVDHDIDHTNQLVEIQTRQRAAARPPSPPSDTAS